jgi:hypothetical protein
MIHRRFNSPVHVVMDLNAHILDPDGSMVAWPADAHLAHGQKP